ncbi:enoyl-CoA hydratase/isomerase family protein [Jeotgalibacillus sp. R-1-5s-1]|uniref:enoyl-CoA hydratase/isomerase family protein n=1 Tax=Jeotgalibacillus sp. R-1-5s-1 TaxID=2555897 RepID=UPI00106C84D9|nr:enoyl-CoA hydratase/isomerase family protein [Jeotgalibacillus sp. R-1-5s-1]TFE03590.1 enoyl-CoA hydratase/isomerase family protein [Jeotgalibacillus sp. R-1-5s-1]
MGFIITKLDQVLVFKISRPDKRNAVNYEVMDGLAEAIQLAEQDDHIKALLITGEGEKAFCAGGDLQSFHALKTQSEAYEMLSKMGDILYRLAVLPKLTVAFINGTAIGGGCEIAAACDYRVAKKGAKLGFVQGDLAITTGWGGGTLLYERLVPSQAFRLLTEANIHTAEQLFEAGFIDATLQDETLEAVIASIKRRIDKSPGVLSAYKNMLIEKWKRGDLEQRMKNEVHQCSVLWESEEHHKAVEQFLQSK